ncbi:MAG: aldehyde ferredoxin oxidoreductase, partial [Anaerolineae bacterium]|nr:aldehyde ferredoxin oxidoreductase [Anaerolineae bacterium]NIN98426.1 aldehyde ferredoxin oxidoreductase [Anaerolineae bacterium]NIQ81331.1 aldehyde ferredoxin oxidoreductase [Anaerolineae bacterium]
LGDDEIEVGVIGPAGENKVLFACIIFSLYNSASRGGPGAVMGSKNLKALAVRGTGGLRVAEADEFFELAARTRRELSQDAGTNTLHRWGTSGSLPDLNEMEMLPSY